MTGAAGIRDRLRFHGITADTAAILRANKDYIMSVLPHGLDAFYDHVAQFPETARFFRNREHMMHAKAMQLRHWSLITEGRFDETYVASVTKIGEVHNRIGLEPKWYIGGYNFLLVRLMETIVKDMASGLFSRGGPGKALAVQQAVTKALMLDMDFAISVYLDAGRRERRETLDRLAGQFDSSVGSIVTSLSSSATQMQSAAQALTATAEQAAAQSGIVASASEEASASVRSVAAATEEMTASVQEISRQVAGSAEIAGRAVQVAGETVRKVEALSEAARRIGAIVDLINNIAGQTNLLALNATIEAARAGEAGKGFAVVAQEVKMLADQTGKATAEIGSQIGSIQDATKDASGSIDVIAGIIRQMNEITSSITAAVQQQGQATNEIAGNVQLAARGTEDVAHTIVSVSQASADTGRSAGDVLSVATTLAGQATDLRREVDGFLRNIAAA